MTSKINFYVKKLVEFGLRKNILEPGRFHVYAALVKNGKIVSLANNYQCFHHAEAALLKKNSRFFRKPSRTKYDLVVIRLYADGTISNAIPCFFCASTLRKEKNLRHVYYSNKEGDMIRVNAFECHNHEAVPSGILWKLTGTPFLK
jgi:hypothetical protein